MNSNLIEWVSKNNLDRLEEEHKIRCRLIDIEYTLSMMKLGILIFGVTLAAILLGVLLCI